jgi:hypothetical protein
LAGLGESWDTPHDAVSYAQVQMLINDGIQEGKDTSSCATATRLTPR